MYLPSKQAKLRRRLRSVRRFPETAFNICHNCSAWKLKTYFLQHLSLFYFFFFF